MNATKIAVFIALAYLLAWSLAFAFFAAGGRVESSGFIMIAVLYMFAPAVAAIVAQRLVCKHRIKSLGLFLPSWRWVLVSWLLPAALVWMTLILSACWPGVSVITGINGLLEKLQTIVPAEKLIDIQRQLANGVLARPGVLFGAAAIQSLVVGPTINAAAALGEELGWRGLLASELLPLGFWRSSFMVGVVWGVWHLPVIINGYNYPGHPLLGPFMMTLLTILFSPLLAYVRFRSGSVFPAAIFHGTFNAVGSFAAVFLRGGDSTTVGVTGIVGLLVFCIADIVLWMHLRRRGGLAPSL